MLSKFTSAALALVVLATLGGADDDEKDFERLQGVWRVVATEEQGTEQPVQGVYTLTVKGNKLYQRHQVENGVELEYVFQISAGRNPKTIDLVIVRGRSEQEKALVGHGLLGIYALTGDRLKFCVNPDARPKTFETRGKSRHTVLMTLQRQDR